MLMAAFKMKWGTCCTFLPVYWFYWVLLSGFRGLGCFFSCTHATAVVPVVMFHCSEWIHQLKNVLIIFIFYYTAAALASCVLANSLFPLNRL